MKQYIVTHKYDRDPSEFDDSADGFDLYQQWINTSTGERFECKSNTVGAAVWESVGASAMVQNVAQSWDGSLYTIDMSVNAQYTLNVNNGVSAIAFGLSFPDDADTKIRDVIVRVNNTANNIAISTITFQGNWHWSVGDPVNGIAANSVMELSLRNINNNAVKALTDVEA